MSPKVSHWGILPHTVVAEFCGHSCLLFGRYYLKFRAWKSDKLSQIVHGLSNILKTGRFCLIARSYDNNPNLRCYITPTNHLTSSNNSRSNQSLDPIVRNISPAYIVLIFLRSILILYSDLRLGKWNDPFLRICWHFIHSVPISLIQYDKWTKI